MYSNWENIGSLLCLIAGIGLLPAPTFAQQTSVGADTGVSRTVVEERLKGIQESGDLDAEDRDELIDRYRQALGSIDDRRKAHR